MGGKSDDSGSREMINMQKEEAAQARARETTRQGRLDAGLKAIRNMFEGAPVMEDVGNRFDWGNYAAPANAKGVGTGVSGLPAGYTYVQVPGAAAAGPAATTAQRSGGGGYTREARPTMMAGNSGQQRTVIGGDHGAQGGSLAQRTNPNQRAVTAAAGATGAAPAGWAIRGPDGRIYQPGEDIGFTTQRDTGARTGQWQENFFERFKKGILDYYNPQVQEQYAKGKDETTFRHARAGTLRSTSAIKSAADLTKQNLLREGEVRSKADTSAAALRDRVNAERQKAESQLYATENPEVAANQALSAITNISAEKPDMTPLGQVFEIASIGGANLLSAAQNAALRKKYVPGLGGAGATSIVG